MLSRLSPLVISGLCLLCAATAIAQTNQITVRIPARNEIWDYADRLDLTPEQRTKLNQIQAGYRAAQAKLREANKPDATPDQKQAARQGYVEALRSANKQVGELLTAEQKKKFSALRAADSPSRPPATNSEANTNTPAMDDAPFSRKPPRAMMSDEEYRKLAAELRAVYSKPPTNWPAPTIDVEVKPRYVELGLLPPVKYPTNNPYSDAKAELGKKLYFDPRLSGSGQIACASCHDPELGWSDGRTVSFGHGRKELKRNAPTLNNVAHEKLLFWDGRANSLEQQVMDVVTNEDEMRSDAKSVRERLSRVPGYTNEFAKVFGTPEITLTRAAEAVATFERGIISRANAFDAFVRGDTNALSDAAVRGLHLFRTTARCVNCHLGPAFTDGRFHNEGLTYHGRKLEDLGRYAVTKQPADVGAFRTPTLRNLSRTAPYMHNGLFDLNGVLNLYNAGMPNIRPKPEQANDLLFPVKSKHLQPLGLNTQDLADLKEFLESLTETRLRVRPPELPADL